MNFRIASKIIQIRCKLICLFVIILLLSFTQPGVALELFTYKDYHPSGLLKTEFTYYNGTIYYVPGGYKVRHGVETYYRDNESHSIASISNYSHGIRNGPREIWYPPETEPCGYKKQSEVNYLNGQRHGSNKVWSRHYEDPYTDATYRYDQLDGPYKKRDYTYGHLLLESNYKNGLRHGDYKDWSTFTYTDSDSIIHENQQRLIRMGHYSHGKRDGFWTSYAGIYPFLIREQGYYGNGEKCGEWQGYYADGTPYNDTDSYGRCTPTYPDAGGDELPAGGEDGSPVGEKFEIRGHVYDHQTHEPLRNVLVQAGSVEATTDGRGFYAIVLDTADVYTLNGVLDTYYNYSKIVDMTGTQYITVDIRLKPGAAGEKPAITQVDSVNGDFFMEGLSVDNAYVVSVDWRNDAPGRVIFEVNGIRYEAQANEIGATYTFDMGSDFTGSLDPFGNTLKIIAVNYSGEASDPEILNPIVIPQPGWALNFGNGFEIISDGKHLTYKLGMDWPEEPIEIQINEENLGSTLWTAWGLFPYLGGRDFGIPGTQAFFELEAKTDGSGSIAAGGKSGFEAAGGKIEIKLGGKGNLKYEPNKGLGWKGTSLILGIKGTVEKEVGPVTIIPALEGAVNLPLIGGAVGWFNNRAKIKGTVSTGSEMALEIMSDKGKVGFNKVDVETNAGIGLGMSIELIDDLDAEITGGGTEKFFWQVPANPGYFKKMEAALTANVTFTIMGWKWTSGYTHPFTYPETTAKATALGLPSYTMTSISRDFLTHGEYNRPMALSTRSTLDISGNDTQRGTQVIENVFPYSNPAIAEDSGNVAIAYVYLDPNDEEHQDTEIFYSLFDGTTYSLPAPILNDTRADFSPAIAFDNAGKIICVWQQVKTDNFTGSSITDMVPLLEIVYSVYDPAAQTPEWSAPLALTNNNFMDYTPMLRKGADKSLMLVWLSNPQSLLIGTAAAPSRIHSARWDGTGFSSIHNPQIDFFNSFKFSFAYNGAEGILAYTKDMDGVLVTPADAAVSAVSDQEIFYLRFDGSDWAEPHRVTDDNLADTASQVVYTANGPELVWLKDDTLVRLTGWGPYVKETIKAGILSAGLMDFKLYSDPSDHLVLLWQDLDQNGIDLFYSVFDTENVIWSNDLKLTNDPEMEKDFCGQFDENGMLHLGFNKKKTDSQTTGLFHLTYKLDVDLEMPQDNFFMDISNPFPGDDILLTAGVSNAGDLAVTDLPVSFYLGDPLDSGELIGTVNLPIVKAGGLAEASLNWKIPTTIDNHRVYVVVDPDNTTTESDETNNTAQMDILRPDLAAVHCHLDQKPDGSYHVVATIKNKGALAAKGVHVAFSAQDHILGTLVIPGILPGLTANVSFPASLEYYDYTSLEPLISFTVDPDHTIQETNEENNTASAIYTLNMINPSGYDFAKVPDIGATQTIVILNKTPGEMTIGEIALFGPDAGDFAILDAPCENQILQAQAGCIIRVQCLPSTLGTKKASLVISGNQDTILASASLTGELGSFLLGDVNGNFVLDLIDVMSVLKLSTGLSESQVHVIVDTDKDGKISSKEAIFALQKNADTRH